MRRRRRNPDPITLLLVGGAVAAGAFFLLKKPSSSRRPGVAPGKDGTSTLTAANPERTQFTALPITAGMPPGFFDDVPAGFCIGVIQGAAGFRIAGDIATGEVVAMRSITAGKNGFIMAESIDPRTPRNLAPMAITPAMSSGAGDC